MFHANYQRADIFLAGLLATDYQQIDDTGSRVRGQNYYTQIVCNPYYTAYFTAPHKDRLTVLDILRGDPDGKTRSYLFNEEAFDLLERFEVSKKLIFLLRERVYGKLLDEVQMQQLLVDFSSQIRARAKSDGQGLWKRQLLLLITSKQTSPLWKYF